MGSATAARRTDRRVQRTWDRSRRAKTSRLAENRAFGTSGGREAQVILVAGKDYQVVEAHVPECRELSSVT